MIKFLKALFKKKEIPNCSLCKWWETEGWVEPTCLAQGGASSLRHHNNSACKKLYWRIK